MSKNEIANTNDTTTAKPRMVPLTIRVDESTYEDMRSIAEEQHLSVAEVNRKALEGSLADYMRRVVFLDSEQGEEVRRAVAAVLAELTACKVELDRIGVNYNQQTKAVNEIAKLRRQREKYERGHSFRDIEQRVLLGDKIQELEAKLDRTTTIDELKVAAKLAGRVGAAMRKGGDEVWHMLV